MPLQSLAGGPLGAFRLKALAMVTARPPTPSTALATQTLLLSMEVDIYVALLQFAESFLSMAFFVFDQVPCSLLVFLPKCGDSGGAGYPSYTLS